MALEHSEVLRGLAEILNDVAGVPTGDVEPDKSFVDQLDVDSLSMVEILMVIEERFGVRIPDDEAGNFKNVGDVVDYIVLHGA